LWCGSLISLFGVVSVNGMVLVIVVVLVIGLVFVLLVFEDVCLGVKFVILVLVGGLMLKMELLILL